MQALPTVHKTAIVFVINPYESQGVYGLCTEGLNFRLLLDTIKAIGFPCDTIEEAMQIAVNYVKSGKLEVPTTANTSQVTYNKAALSKLVKAKEELGNVNLAFTACILMVVFRLTAHYIAPQ